MVWANPTFASVHTAKWVVDKCFSGDLIKGRTVLLVVCVYPLPLYKLCSKGLQTHNVALTKPVADFVVSMGSDGRILSQGSVSEALKLDKKFAKELKTEEEKLKKADDEVEAHDDVSKPADGKLILAEEQEEGHVGWGACRSSGLGSGIYAH